MNEAHRWAYKFARDLRSESWENAYQVKMEVCRLSRETWLGAQAVLNEAKSRAFELGFKPGQWAQVRLKMLINGAGLSREYDRVAQARARAKKAREIGQRGAR